MFLLLAALTAGAADDVATWLELHQALLHESADGDLGAAAEYQRIVRNVGEPLRSEALYWLGRARYTAHDLPEARDALLECVRTAPNRERCQDLIDQIELDDAGIRELPVEWTFEGPGHGLLHPHIYRNKGTIRLARDTRSGPALEWSTQVAPQTDDQLWLSFRHPEPPPRGLRFITWTGDQPAQLRLIVFDDAGQRFGLPNQGIVQVAVNEPVLVRVPLSQLEALAPEDAVLDPARIDRLILQDATAFYSRATGANRIYLDDFEVY